MCMSVCVGVFQMAHCWFTSANKISASRFISIAQASVFVCLNGSNQFVFLQSQHYKSNIDKVGTLYGNLTHICVILLLSGSFIHKHMNKRPRAQGKKHSFHKGHHEIHQTVQSVARARDFLRSLRLSSGTRQRSKCCVKRHLRALEISPSLQRETAVSFVRQDCCCFCPFLSVHLSSERKTPAGDERKLMRISLGGKV